MDGTYIKAHQHAAGIETLEEKTIGKSKGGNTTKVQMLADAKGNPIDFILTPGNIHIVTVGNHLLYISVDENVIADKGYGVEYSQEAIFAKTSVSNIQRRSNSKK